MPTPIKLKAAAGGSGGSWYVLLEGIARLVNAVHPEIAIEVVEGGGVSNHAWVGSGEMPMAILNPPMTRAALVGDSPFDQAWPELRIGITNLTANHLHFVLDASVPLISLEEWFDQRYPLRIPVDRTSTVDRLVFQIALAHYGVSEDDLEDWGGGAIPAMNYHQQLELYRAEKVNALWQFMGIPSPSIQDAHNLRPIKVLPLSPDLIDELVRRGWQASEIPAGAYGSVENPLPTVSMGTSLGFHSQVPNDVVFAITSAICEHPERVRYIHPAAADFDPTTACLNPGGPLHPGAERYYTTQRNKPFAN
ncbi:MAG: TAXI family TRAP transporter solute-binding subunit [Chloroflexi bacterium]|nr:TAXI family TRAP transporter solute-binding subunit [Chloroflexota bacterium]MDA1219497.1 TAXI family TRAP transporter solute-binding subunit [Chloroflexota bacterium]